MNNPRAEEIVAKFSPNSKEKNTLYWMASFCDWPTKEKICGHICWASLEKIAERAGVSVRTVQRHLNAPGGLIARKEVECTYMGSGYRTNYYQINICKQISQAQLKLPLVQRDKGRQNVTLKGDIVSPLTVTECHPTLPIPLNLKTLVGDRGNVDLSNLSASTRGGANNEGITERSPETEKIWVEAMDRLAFSLTLETGGVHRGAIPGVFSVES